MSKFLIAILLSFSIAFAANSTNYFKANPEVIIQPGKVVVKYKKMDSYGAVNKKVKDQLSAKFGLQAEKAVFESAQNIELKNHLNLNNIFVYEVPTVVDVNKLIIQLNADPSIEYAEPIYLSPLEEIPNDPLYGSQQHLPQISAPEAWDDQYGSSSVIIGVIDSGVDWDHEDLADIIWMNSGEIADNGIDDDGNGYIDDIRGWDFVTGVSGSGATNSSPNEDGEVPDNNPMDYNGHGTHVAGIAAAETNNNIGIASVSSGAQVMSLRAGWNGNDGRGYVSSLFAAQAYMYAADNGAHITNQSSGSSGQLIVDAAFYAFLNGVLIIESAGNSNNQTPSALGAQPWIISVASLDPNDTKSSFSNYGDYIAVSAPGSSILSTIVEPSSFFGGNKYVRLSGTSMAAPLVASVAGLVKAKYPGMDVIELFTQVVKTADNLDDVNPAFVDALGTGKVNAARALSESVTPLPPNLQFENITISETSGNGNGILDPGETVDVNIEISNMWAATTNISANLSALVEWPITILDGSENIASIGSVLDTNTSKQTVTFSVSCSADAFPTAVPMQLVLSGTDVDDTLNFQLGIAPQLLFVADFEEDNNGTVDFSQFYFDDFNTQKISFDYVHRLQTDITYEMLSKYNIVIWACEWAFPSLDANDRAAIEEYLDNGGALFLSGQDIGWDLNENADNLDITFFNNYLKSNYLADDAGMSFINGVDSDPISHGISSEFFQIRRSSANQYPDRISGIGGAQSIFNFNDGTSGAIRYRGDYDLVYFAFGGYESILDDDARRTVLSRIISWFSGIQYWLSVVGNTEDTESPIEVNITVQSESSLSSVKLYYDTDGTPPYNILEMTNSGNDNYQASIPPQADGTDITYFIGITTDDGNSIVTGENSFYVGADIVPPTVQMLSNPLRNSINLSGISPYELLAFLDDEYGIDGSTATINYWVNDGSVISEPLSFFDLNTFSGTIDFSDSRLTWGDEVSYYFAVNDLSSNANLGTSDTVSFMIDTTQVVDDFELPFLEWDLTGTWGLSSTVKKNGNYSLSDSPVGTYENNTNSTATYKIPFDLSNYITGEISYWVRSQLEVGVDSLLLEISNDGEDWQIIDAISQNFIFFSQRIVNISNYTTAENSEVYLRFRLYTNGSTTADGVYIDDVIVNVTPDPTLSVERLDEIPLSFDISQNYPNPFNPSTTINFAIPVKSDVKIVVYNVLGEVVKILADANMNVGTYSVSFDAANTLSSGIYFYRISALGIDGQNFVHTKKMMLIK
ncbi:MAG: S8 family serine peptidase [Melioribacteraceae bacterium]|nr:S8 family serine peptidase [Melioribacteraceae bacterium]